MAFSGVIIAVQLTLLVFFQWPVGNWLSRKNSRFGLQISFYAFALGCLLLGLSSIWTKGIFILLISLIPFSLGLAAFLPTATESIIKLSPIDKYGMAMSIYSQCFAISAFIAPLIAGFAIDNSGDAMKLWISAGIICIAMIPIIESIKFEKTRH